VNAVPRLRRPSYGELRIAYEWDTEAGACVTLGDPGRTILVVTPRGWCRARRCAAVLAATAICVFALTACDPVLHPQFVVREGPSSPVTFELLSGDGNFAVVKSTAASTTVPGAGLWRIDRRDGSVVALPSGYRADAISQDGNRVLIQANCCTAGISLWSNGAVLSPPSGRFSEDLTYCLFVDTDRVVKSWTTADQSVHNVETAFPRPAGTTDAQANGISDNGRVVQYTLFGNHPIERFADLDTGHAVDVANLNGTGNGTGSYTIDHFALAAGGTTFLHVHETGTSEGFTASPDESWVERVALPTGTVIHRYTNTSGESFGTSAEAFGSSFISANGKVAWVYAETGEECPNSPKPAFCITASRVIAVFGNGARVFSAGADPVASIAAVGGSKRFLVVAKYATPISFQPLRGPVEVYDFATGTVETLGAAAPYAENDPSICNAFGKTAPCAIPAASVNAQMSNDNRVVATTTMTGTGWYEYSASS
jgi:hypothetical protein